MRDARLKTTLGALVPLVLAVAALAGYPSSALAQGGIRLIPQVGLYAPVSDLGRASSTEGAVEIGERESTLGFGLALELGARRTVSFRLNGVYGTESEVPVDGTGCTDCTARSTVAAVTGSAVFRPLPNLIVVQPYLQAGGGLKRYDFDEDDAQAEGVDAFVSDQNELTGQLGVGLEFNLLGFRALLELSDFISGFDAEGGEAETQHDFFLTLGIALGG